MGDWIDGMLATQVFDRGKLAVLPSSVPAGASTVPLALSGATEIAGYDAALRKVRYRVGLEGTVTAQVCPPK